MGTKLKSRDRFGGTPLDDAIREGHKEMVEYFLDQSVSAQAAAKIWFGKKGI